MRGTQPVLVFFFLWSQNCPSHSLKKIKILFMLFKLGIQVTSSQNKTIFFLKAYHDAESESFARRRIGKLFRVITTRTVYMSQ